MSKLLGIKKFDFVGDNNERVLFTKIYVSEEFDKEKEKDGIGIKTRDINISKDINVPAEYVGKEIELSYDVDFKGKAHLKGVSLKR